MKKFKRLISLITVFLFLFTGSAFAVPASIDFAFTASTSSDVAGYLLYSREVNDSTYDGPYQIENLVCENGGECTFTIDLDLGYGNYYFAAKAYDTSDNLSDMSAETPTFFTVEQAPPPPDTIKPEPPTQIRTLFQKIVAWFKSFMKDRGQRDRYRFRFNRG